MQCSWWNISHGQEEECNQAGATISPAALKSAVCCAVTGPLINHESKSKKKLSNQPVNQAMH